MRAGTVSGARRPRLPHREGRQRLLKLLLVGLMVTLPQFFATGTPVDVRAAAEDATTCGGPPLPALRQLIGPDIVGECVDRERYLQSNGDTIQATTRGLLIEKASNQ